MMMLIPTWTHTHAHIHTCTHMQTHTQTHHTHTPHTHTAHTYTHAKAHTHTTHTHTPHTPRTTHTHTHAYLTHTCMHTIYNQKSFCTLCSSCIVVVFIYYCCCCCCCIYSRSSSLHGRLLHCSGHQTEVVCMYIRMYVTHSDRSNGHVNPSNQGAAGAHLTHIVGSLEQRVECFQYN